MVFHYMTSFHSCLFHFPTLHAYNVHGPMSSQKNPRISLHLPSKSPSSSSIVNNPTLTHGNIRHNLPKPHSFNIRASNKIHYTSSDNNNNKKLILINAAITVTLAVANRVLYKLALVPMKQYVVIYFSILYMRHRVGIVTNEMIAIPKSPFVAIGVLEALAVVTGMSSAAMLPGPVIPILSQTFLVWQLTFSALLLGRGYSFNQITGCLLVAIGVVVAVASNCDMR